MEPDGFLCSCNAQSQKVGCKDVRSFLCSRSARHPKGLARRPQSKAPHALAWLSIELRRKYEWTRAVGDQSSPPSRKKIEERGRSMRRMHYSAMLTPEPPISFGTSFIFGNPSLIRSFVS